MAKRIYSAITERIRKFKQAECTAHINIGDRDDTKNKRVRIIHISDTHSLHDDFLRDIPDGDILIHSGDFVNCFLPYNKTLTELDTFLGKLPHKYKIFVAGNHEGALEKHTPEDIQRQLHNTVYLQDSGVTLLGIKIYGTPWNVLRSTGTVLFLF